MKKIRIHYFIRLLFFWLLYFAMFRMFFILYHHAKIPDGQHSDTGRSFIEGIPLDIAVIALFCVLPFLLWTWQQFNKSRVIHLINLGYHYVLISGVSLLSIFNIKMYGEYEKLLSTEELAYLLYPGDLFTIWSAWSLLLLVTAAAVFAILGIRSYRRYIFNFSYPVDDKRLRLGMIIIIPVLIIACWILGTEKSDRATPADYSVQPVNNDIATNTIWYLGHSFCQGNDTLISPSPIK
jgi:hypothetical protein